MHSKTFQTSQAGKHDTKIFLQSCEATNTYVRKRKDPHSVFARKIEELKQTQNSVPHDLSEGGHFSSGMLSWMRQKELFISYVFYFLVATETALESDFSRTTASLPAAFLSVGGEHPESSQKDVRLYVKRKNNQDKTILSIYTYSQLMLFGIHLISEQVAGLSILGSHSESHVGASLSPSQMFKKLNI